MRGLVKRILRNQDGQALVLVALLMVVLMGFAAFAVDVGMARAARTKMQGAADAAALAGAQELPSTGNARDKAEKYGEANGAHVVTVDPTYGPNQIEVLCTRNVPYVFARVLGFRDVDVTGRAVAGRVSADGPFFDYALFAGGEHLHLSFNGRQVTVRGNVHSNNVVEFNGEDHYISGSVTSSGVVEPSVKGTIIDGDVIGFVPKVEMPDFSSRVSRIKNEAKECNNYHAGSHFVRSNESINSSLYVGGTLTISGDNIVVEGDIYASDNILISGSNMEFRGMIYSPGIGPSGNVTVSGRNINIVGPVVGLNLEFSGQGYGASGGIIVDPGDSAKTMVRLIE